MTGECKNWTQWTLWTKKIFIVHFVRASPLPQNKTAGHQPGSFVNITKLYTTPQSLILKSSLPLAITLPSGEKATDCTSCVWPR